MIFIIRINCLVMSKKRKILEILICAMIAKLAIIKKIKLIKKIIIPLFKITCIFFVNI